MGHLPGLPFKYRLKGTVSHSVTQSLSQSVSQSLSREGQLGHVTTLHSLSLFIRERHRQTKKDSDKQRHRQHKINTSTELALMCEASENHLHLLLELMMISLSCRTVPHECHLVLHPAVTKALSCEWGSATGDHLLLAQVDSWQLLLENAPCSSCSLLW